MEELHSKILHLIKFIQQFGFFGEVHMVEFFTQDHWGNLLGSDTQQQLMSQTTSELRQMLSQKPAKPITISDPCTDNTKLHDLQDFLYRASEANLKSLNVLSTAQDVIDLNPGAYNKNPPLVTDLRSLITTEAYMNKKKSHEIQQMSPMVNILSSITKCKSVLDVGSGKGYLSSYLSLCYNLNVIGIDIAKSNSDGALLRAEKFKLYWSKHLKNKVPSASESLQDLNLNFEPVTARIDSSTQIKDFSSSDNESFILSGLHTCGDLCSSVISLFVKEPKILGVCVVGCCYHLLTESKEVKEEHEAEKEGFPTSEFVRENGIFLGRNNRMVSLQASERRAVEECTDEPTSSEWSLFYRALLSVIIRDQFEMDPSDKNIRIGKIFSKSKGFVDYVRRSLRKLKLDNEKMSDEKIQEYFDLYESKVKTLITFHLLRQLYSPAVESLILLDKLCHLRELGEDSKNDIYKSFLVQIFEAVESPRCYALICVKRSAVV